MKVFLSLLVLLIPWVAWTQTAPQPAAPAPVDIQFILDASGSMEALLGTESQMEVAKRSLKQTLNAIPPGTSVSLCVYAHRIPKSDQAGSCQDVEILVPFQPLNTTAFSTRVDTLKPNGYTPIAYSLRECSKSFLGKESQHVMILLSDGEETCGGDPVAEAKNLLAQGFKITIHTIGFRVDEKTRGQLASISNATGGSYFDASDAASLSQNLLAATQKALVIDKPQELVRGQEIRGGNQYHEAVPLQPGIEYRLDHHQRKDQYDYFHIDVKSGQVLNFSIATTDKGVSITPDNRVSDNQNPYAGFRIVGPDFQEITHDLIIGTRHQKKDKNIVVNEDKRLYILVGNQYASQHKDSPFKVEIKIFADANTNQDAPENVISAMEISPGEYPQNWILHSKDIDAYKVNATAGQVYTVVVSPQSMEPVLNVIVYDQDRVQMFSKRAPNSGAVVRMENIVPKNNGPLYLLINDRSYGNIREPAAYSFSIQSTGMAPVAGTTTTQPQMPTPSANLEVAQKMIEQVVEREGNPVKEKIREGASRLLLYGLFGLVALVAVIVVILVLVLKKKPKGP